ncbi:Uncharacterized protein APZ42_018975 [Daphnia magna]|uniref:Uncharacterized protein n=1 Tax=Daphnia magna TaxID=35525 RepID=A0A164YYC3_9CRUS|nr:Uncharacterized protein APZ42_018975 [Daphnia magna]
MCVCVEFPKKSLNYACTRMPAGGRLRASLTSLFLVSLVRRTFFFLFFLFAAPLWKDATITRFTIKQQHSYHIQFQSYMYCQTGLPVESSSRF